MIYKAIASFIVALLCNAQILQSMEIDLYSKGNVQSIFESAMNNATFSPFDEEQAAWALANGADQNVKKICLSISEEPVPLILSTIVFFQSQNHDAQHKKLKFLLDHGANIHQKFENGKSLIHYARTASAINYLRQIINAQDNEGNTALMYAAKGTWFLLQVLLSCDADPNVRNAQGQNFLHKYILDQLYPDARIIKELIEKHGACCTEDLEGNTIFHYFANKIKFELPLNKNDNEFILIKDINEATLPFMGFLNQFCGLQQKNKQGKTPYDLLIDTLKPYHPISYRHPIVVATQNPELLRIETLKAGLKNKKINYTTYLHQLEATGKMQ
jgi:ankyrin repeat protein